MVSDILCQAQTMKFPIKISAVCDKIRSFLRSWSHLLKKSLMEHFIFLCSDSSEFLYTDCIFILQLRTFALE